jgi:uncharacterized surface protein with fasciclin (FAS1) repeats
MNNHFTELAKKVFAGLCLAIVCGGFTACKDDYTLDDEGNYPSWQGGSIYETLKNPSSIESDGEKVLTGTFNDYVRLIDDLGYAETMSKTGSKTIFPANDEAFKRFYENNSWGVTKYDDLTEAMKKQLLYASMLDNTLLVEMLSNIPNGSTAVTPGQAMKHQTTVSIIDTITHWKGSASMPINNNFWTKYYNKGIHLVMDGTTPMMVHFTEEQMTTNAITTQGENSDFEVITGTPYNAQEHSAYIFRNKIINADVTCKNGYIHQMQDVLVPPGNLAQLIRNNGESNLFSRMLDRFAAPYPSRLITNNYNNYAQANQLAQIDTIFEMRYMSVYSQGDSLNKDPNGVTFPELLPYDPGWNSYNNGTGENSYKDVAAMFVPTDQALENFFLPGGEGEFLIKQFGKLENTKANLPENIDSIPLKNVNQLVSNLMKKSFVNTVPSKFGHIMDEASDPMGLTLDVINRNSDNTYDVKIANNGVAYMLNKMFAPPSLVAVSAPVTLKDNMRVMNEAVYDGKTRKLINLGLNYYAYLLAMSANYAFFIPTDQAFATYYVDPCYLNESQPRALKFYWQDRSPYLYCSQWKYDPIEQTIGDSIPGRLNASAYKSQLIDILNYHTVVLNNNETLGANGNKYYKTKHGGAIRYDHGTRTVGNAEGKIIYADGTVTGGAPIKGSLMMPNITEAENKQNGVAYTIDHVIQAPQQSVLSVLTNNAQFAQFLKLCMMSVDTDDDNFNTDDMLEFASDKMLKESSITHKKGKDAYSTFVAKGGLTDNVNYFNSYNYTVFAPDDDAMQKAYNMGLPTWNDVKAVYDEWGEQWKNEKAEGKTTSTYSDEVKAARNKALAMIEEINTFIRYHFQDNSVFADNVVEKGTYPTACSDTIGIRQKVIIGGGDSKLTVSDRLGQTITIDANDQSRLSNVLTRDYVIVNRAISTSSFATVHQISTPLSTHVNRGEAGKDNGRYDFMWTANGAASRLKNFRRQYEDYLWERYIKE